MHLVPVLMALAPSLTSPTQVPSDEPRERLDDPAYALPIDGGLARQDGSDELEAPPPRTELGAKILFVNFDGAQMNFCGDDDPHNDCSTIFQGNVLPFSGDAVKRASVIQVIRKRVADFGITVTDQRPAQGDYDMEMVGNWQGEQPGFAGVAPNIDCFDNTGGEVSFTLEMAQTADGIAEIVLQEAAHTWGLEHVDEQSDLLYPTTSGSSKEFRDECYKIVSDTMLNPSSGICNSMHTMFCDSGWQNSHEELLTVFGASTPDTVAPTVEITAPDDGAEVEPDFQIKIGFADDQTPVIIDATITIESDALPEPVSQMGSYAGPSELEFPVAGLPPGEYTIKVDGTDESANPASDQITVTVLGQTGGTGESTGGGGDGTSGSADGGPMTTGDGTSDDGAADSSDSGTVPEDTTTDRGCACGPDGRMRGAGSLGALAFVLLVRRRRSRSRRTDTPNRAGGQTTLA